MKKLTHFVLPLVCVCCFSSCSKSGKPTPEVEEQATPALHAASGMMVGEVSETSALIQVRLTQTNELVDGDVPGAEGMVQFIFHPAGEEVNPAQSGKLIETSAANDFIARAHFTHLQPGTEYLCESYIGPSIDDLRPGPQASFRTLQGGDGTDPVSFVVVTGMNYAKFHGDNRIDRDIHLKHNNRELPDPYEGPDKNLGYPGLASILKLKPDFFVGTGDNVYYDTPKQPRAETVPQMRQKWHEQFVQQRYVDLFAKIPTYWEIDDHDFRYDDCDNTTDQLPSTETAIKVMLEQLPMTSDGSASNKTYRTHRISRDLQIWLTEGRIYRSPNKDPDGPNKTIWGTEQRDWLKRTLSGSDATFKILISNTPVIGPDDKRKTDNHTNIGGFRHEREQFFAWLKETGIQHFYIVCGDRHWQYHSVSPEGIEEFSSGALVDANSRLGRKPGDPLSTDPDGLIKQPYFQDPASGGFLLVKVSPASVSKPASLGFHFHDEHGKLLHEHIKTN